MAEEEEDESGEDEVSLVKIHLLKMEKLSSRGF